MARTAAAAAAAAAIATETETETETEEGAGTWTGAAVALENVGSPHSLRRPQAATVRTWRPRNPRRNRCPPPPPSCVRAVSLSAARDCHSVALPFHLLSLAGAQQGRDAAADASTARRCLDWRHRPCPGERRPALLLHSTACAWGHPLQSHGFESKLAHAGTGRTACRLQRCRRCEGRERPAPRPHSEEGGWN